jgi:hypothetical protein
VGKCSLCSYVMPRGDASFRLPLRRLSGVACSFSSSHVQAVVILESGICSLVIRELWSSLAGSLRAFFSFFPLCYNFLSCSTRLVCFVLAGRERAGAYFRGIPGTVRVVVS